MAKQNLKYRKQKVKREHHLLPGLALSWRKSQPSSGKSIIPARSTAPSGGRGPALLEVQNPDGCQTPGQIGGGVQEIFIVTSEPEALREIIENYK